MAKKRDPIAKAHEQFVAGDELGALEALLGLWRKGGQPALADLIDAATVRVTEVHGTPIEGKTRKALEAWWTAVEAEKKTADLPNLLSVLPRMRARSARDMLTSLLEWPRDPRFTRPLLDFAKAPPRGYQGTGSGGFWQRHGTLLGRTADSRALPVITKIIDECAEADGWAAIDGFMMRGLDRARSSIEKKQKAGKAGGELDPALAGSHDKFLRALEGSPLDKSTVESLYAAVYENPDELELRVVLADALLEVGDPRGEFITLQCRPLLGEKLTTKQKRRMSQLLDEHEEEWLGPLKAVVLKKDRVFEGGFLTKARIDTNQERLAQSVVGCREWATVRELHIGIWPASVNELLDHPVMRSLKRTTGRRRD